MGESLLVSGAGSGADFAVDFVCVGVSEELIEESVGRLDGEDLIGGEQGREAILPVVVAALDLAFGLGSGGVAQGDAVKVESLAELGEGVRGVGEKEGVEIDVEGEREAVGEEDAGEEIEVGEQSFARVKTGDGIEAGGVVEDVEEGLFLKDARRPCVGRSIVLPERAEIAGLPAADGFGGFFVAGVRGEMMGDGPAADTGAVGLEVETAQQLAGDGARRSGARRKAGVWRA